jgi:simple sugar transport system permease protein/ribose transport system permease protein
MTQGDNPRAATVSAEGAIVQRDYPIDLALAGPLLLGIALLTFMAITTEGFLTGGNVKAVLLSSAFLGIIAIGLTPITLGGYLFSLSLGTTAAVCAMAFMYMLRVGFVEAIVLAVLLGAVICALQGWIVGALGGNPIIVTIAAGLLQVAVATWMTAGATVSAPDDSSFRFLTSAPLGLPFPIYVFFGAAIVVEIILRKTRFGRELYLLGDNKLAARRAPLRIARITTIAFAISGAGAACAGVLLAATYDTATLNLQGTYSYDAIAAVLVGGTAIAGGRGSALNTCFGAILISIATSIALLRGYETGIQILVKGLMLLAVVVLVHWAASRRAA